MRIKSSEYAFEWPYLLSTSYLVIDSFKSLLNGQKTNFPIFPIMAIICKVGVLDECRNHQKGERTLLSKGT